MRLHLIEALDAKELSARTGLPVSLTPEASWELKKQGIPYRVLEDFYASGHVYRDSERYFDDQMGWLDAFDRYLGERILGLADRKLTPARAHANALKILLDTVVAEARMLESVLTGTKADEVIYHRRRVSLQTTPSVYALYYERPSFYSSLITPIAKKIGLKEPVIRDADSKERYENAGFSLPERIKSRLRRFLGKKNSSRSAAGPLRALVLHSGSWSMDLVWTELKKNGVEVFTEKDVYQSAYFSSKSAGLSGDCENAVRGLADSGLFDLWNSLCGIDVRAILEPYLTEFIRTEVRRDLVEVDGWLKFYEELRFDFLICRSSAGQQIATALQAARRYPAMKTVCFQHGASVLDERYWTMTEIAPFDVYFAMDTEAKNYFAERSNAMLAGSCRVVESAHYLKAVEKTGAAWHKKSAKTIVYAPAKVFFDIQNFNLTRYPAAWYFEFQMRLIEVFARFPQKNFIFKTLPDQEARLSRWVREFVKSKALKNITFQDGLFTDSLKSADKVLLDLPSTALYEAAVAGVPVYSLMPRACTRWKAAEAMFGNSIGRFSTIDEAIRLAETFIADEIRNYQPKVSLGDGDIAGQLRQFKKEASHELVVSQR